MRPFEPRDDDAVVALYARLHADEPSIDAIDLERWRAFRGLAAFGEGRRFLVVAREGRVVAISTLGELVDRRLGGVVWRVRIFVDPSERRRGVARALLTEREAAAARSGVRAIDGFLNATWAEGRAFAEASGFSVFVHDLFLARAASPFPAVIPAGISVRGYAGTADDAAWISISNATLSRDAGFVEETPESVASFARMPGFGLWLAERDGAPIGHVHVERRGSVGYIQALAVLGREEGRGVGAALLSRGIQALCVGGAERIELCTEKDNVRAQRLYARAGFALEREAYTYRKMICEV